MEGICFEVKPRNYPIKDHPLCALTQSLHGSEDKRQREQEEEEIQYSLTLVGSLAIHPLTTMAMLPWVVAEIQRPQLAEKKKSPEFNGAHSLEVRDQPVVLQISANSVRCILDTTGSGKPWDPLQQMVLFDHRPHLITKLIHNSQEPSYFGCLLREKTAACYVFRCQDQLQVPEIISTLRQAGKSSARQEDTPSSQPSNSQTDASSAMTADAATAFAKRFEVLFCGRVVVAHKKAPPALIDECIEKFGRVSVTGSLAAGIRRALSLTQVTNLANEGADGGGKRPLFFKRDPSFPSLQGLDENGLSPELQRRAADGATGVQPTSLQENRTMLFTIGRSQIFLVSPDTKKVAIEKSFREISFCSQGIRHVDHFGFICRESVECGGCQFVCYVFQCTNEALVDEIMLTLKQAFSVAALQQNSRTQSQHCDSCPLQQLHKLCDGIEGLHPSNAKLELQRHLAGLDNQEQAAVFESTMKARPKSDQEENELIVSCLRRLYEERQKTHTHTHNGQTKKAAPEVCVNAEGSVNSSRVRLEEFKTRAKRSLTESLEGIWKGSSKSKSQRDNSEGESNSSSSTTVNSTNQETSLEEPLCSLLPPSSPLRSHNSTGDLKCLEGSLGGHEGPESPPQGFRRRASTISHSPTLSSSEPSLPPLQPSAATKPKLVRHYSVSTDSPHQSNPSSFPVSSSSLCHRPMRPCAFALDHSALPLRRSPSGLSGFRARFHSSSSVPNFLKFLAPVVESDDTCDFQMNSDVAALSSPGVVCFVGDESPLLSRRHSWRQQIFLRVATPQKGSDTKESTLEVGSRMALGGGVGGGDSSLGVVPEERRKRSGAELRELWQKAILQQILLLRMERENQKLQASESDLQCRRQKLDYDEITLCLKDVTLVWERMLSTTGRSKVKFETEEIRRAVGQGVPRQHRGEIWKFLSEQYLLRQEVPTAKPPNNDTPYKELLKQLTTQQHAILIDLGRTFPTHPYFSAQLGAGQLSLYNLLKAYSLLDPEVGYCQGLSFVAGVLLLHMSEEDAFHMLKFLMYDMGLRKQYRPDMIILQIQMYQLSRLLHDYHRELHTHLELYEIGPSLYAAPWFLTAFASHFPLGFVARVFDMLFLQGSEVIFKVTLSLLGSHKPLILQHDNLESIVEFIKTTLPNLGLVQMEKTINQVFEMDISKQLQAYEVEYHVLQDELLDGPSTLSQSQRVAQLEKTNGCLRQQNLDLLEELQAANAKSRWLETRVVGLVSREAELQLEVKTLQQERAELQQTLSNLRALYSSLDSNSPCPALENLNNTSTNQ
ncbi:LOW QUALITY PROTEIN: TBC1 domain family member 1-like [Xyrauchen texanus]|uniref:LOW QUALITY PROTEIN: TBC1 domain family member 1-like n=1 Tax=Xyrauchen texanus TaxID=154827 RepID=UPI002241BF8E|nr:LOW QUALITY PROTEIN: TBC1 domain family member 1-like [Xyrauchen texanus]